MDTFKTTCPVVLKVFFLIGQIIGPAQQDLCYICAHKKDNDEMLWPKIRIPAELIIQAVHPTFKKQ